ncbi:MAG: hypothetical protein AAF218_08690 [Pseudomonadota bacterium]
MTLKHIALLTLAAGGLSACAENFEGTTAYTGPDNFIAVANDRGRDATDNRLDNAGVAVTPDGCQTWYIDDGIEARASNRLDPVSGLPVCGGQPGVVYGPYRSGSQGIEDRVPRRPFPTRTEQVLVRTTTGHGHHVHPRHHPHQH